MAKGPVVKQAFSARVGDRLRLDRVILADGERAAWPATTAAEVDAFLEEAKAPAPWASGPAFERVARAIDEARIVYAAGVQQREKLRAAARRRNRLNDAVKRIRSELGADCRNFPPFFSKGQLEALDGLEKLELASPLHAAPPWQICAVRIAATYAICLNPAAGWSSDGPAVRFVELALKSIGVRIGKKAIAGVIANAGL